MLARFIHAGDAIDYTPTADVAAGDVVVLTNLVGVARSDIQANTLGSLAIRGVFEFPKVTGDSAFVLIGMAAYWNAASRLATPWSDGGANKLLGKAVSTAGENDLTVLVLLQQLMT